MNAVHFTRLHKEIRSQYSTNEIECDTKIQDMYALGTNILMITETSPIHICSSPCDL